MYQCREYKFASSSLCYRLVHAGFLRLCAPRRRQPGVLHDPGTHLPHELVVDVLPRPITGGDCDSVTTTTTMMTREGEPQPRRRPLFRLGAKILTDWTVITKARGLLCVRACVRVCACVVHGGRGGRRQRPQGLCQPSLRKNMQSLLHRTFAGSVIGFSR